MAEKTVPSVQLNGRATGRNPGTRTVHHPAR